MSNAENIKGYERIRLTINGVDRPVICAPDKDTLAVVLRRMGLTGCRCFWSSWKWRRSFLRTAPGI